MKQKPERFIPSDERRPVQIVTPTRAQVRRSNQGKIRTHWAKRGLKKLGTI